MSKKKEKIEYIDDGRSLADMSKVDEGASRYFRNDGPSTGGFRDRVATFWAAFKMMLLPTLAFGAGVAVMYLIMYFLLKLM